MWAALNKMKCIFVLADKQSKEKIDNLRAFGAKVVVCPTNVEPEDPRSYYSVSKRLSETIPNSYYVNQYENLWNRETHFHTTGQRFLSKQVVSLMFLWRRRDWWNYFRYCCLFKNCHARCSSSWC